MYNKLQKFAAKTLTDVLSTKLHIEANSVSCIFFYQPKTPKNLSQFKNKK